MLAAASSAYAFDAAQEAQNFSKITERERYITATPEFQTELQKQNVRDAVQYPKIIANDPARNFAANICAHRTNECAGDVRFYDWQKKGYGLMHPVLFTARDGATLSGTVWATRSGPATRPGIVITTGSVQAPETLYWGLAATLAKHGYVVLTYDVQGQGRSDTFGAGPDRQEGVPAQAGQPFYDGTEDALNFFFSNPKNPYVPQKSCGNANNGVGTSHAGKQKRRVNEGLDAPYNPFWKTLDRSRVGIAGHSLGASAVSYVGQIDPRVDATVAWDNLSAPKRPSRLPVGLLAAAGQRADHEAGAWACRPTTSSSRSRTPRTRTRRPRTRASSPTRRRASTRWRSIIRGGTHYEFSFLPGNTAAYPFGTATLRGMDMVAWYSTAWFDRYVKCQGDASCKQSADRRLLTNRWRKDSEEGAGRPQ